MQALMERLDLATLQPAVVRAFEQAFGAASETLVTHNVQARLMIATVNTCTAVGALSLATYGLPAIYHKLFHSVQNLRLKYPGKFFFLVTNNAHHVTNPHCRFQVGVGDWGLLGNWLGDC
jgi:hypothetical protein